MSGKTKSGIYHCIIHNFTTKSQSEIETHIRKRHPGVLTSDDPTDFFYEEGDAYRVHCVRDSRDRKPGCGFEKYFHTKEEAERITNIHNRNHKAVCESL